MNESRAVEFTPAEASRILGLSPSSVAELVKSGELKATRADALQSYLKESFIRLYQAEALALLHVEVPARPAAEPEPEPADEAITHSIVEFEAHAARERVDKRSAPRYTPRRQLTGVFRETRFAVLQISSTGLRVRHDEALRPGDVAKVTLAVMNPARSFRLDARVVWTSIAQRGDGPSFCLSGLGVVAGEEQLQHAINLLRACGDLHAEQRGESASRANQPLTGLSDEEVASIIRAVRLLNADPVEAHRWYTRARFALSEEKVKRAAPTRARDREEVVGVWEYLGRRLDLGKIAKVVLWLRQTRAAATA